MTLNNTFTTGCIILFGDGDRSVRHCDKQGHGNYDITNINGQLLGRISNIRIDQGLRILPQN
jgi:hypothetical protein